MADCSLDENTSQCSIDSANIPPDFEMVDDVDFYPKLNVANDGDSNDLKTELSEVLEPLNLDKVMLNSSVHGMRDILKDNTEVINYSGVTYLGSAAVGNPRSVAEIHRNIKILREQSKVPISVLLSIPTVCDGVVNLYDPNTNLSISTFHLNRIVFCTPGPDGTAERQCLAFTCNRGDAHSYQCHVFSCEMHEATKKIMLSFVNAFKQERIMPTTIPIDADASDNTRFRISLDISETDNRSERMTAVHRDRHVFKLRRNKPKQLVIRVERLAPITQQFRVEKCFGLLLSHGRKVKPSEMTLIEINSMGFEDEKIYKIVGHWDPTDPSFNILNTITSKETRVFFTIAVDLILVGVIEPIRFFVESKAKIYTENERFWNLADNSPHTEMFTLKFNKLTKEEMEMSNGDNPISISNGSSNTTPTSVNPTNGDTTDTPDGGGSSQVDILVTPIKATPPPRVSAPYYTVDSDGSLYNLEFIHSQTDIDRMKASRNLAMTPTKSSQRVHIETPVDDSDNDEPLLSGSGIVSREISDIALARWDTTLTQWQISIKKNITADKPKDMQLMVRRGIPECYRGAVWPLLASVHEDKAVMEETYRNLCTKESPCEQVIQRDIHRTFPAHEHFKQSGGQGQVSLYRICKAYSVYDEEVGYCQGLSFLVAALLLHMPEEIAFCVMVKIMSEYGMRDVYKQGFESLHLRIYQLERLLQDLLPDLSSHFVKINLEAHMFASQWFLTLFTAKFPLFMVFHILDVFLSEGPEMIFKVAVSLLKNSSNDLMKLDFEGALKYFRVSLPKLYRTELSANEFLYSAVQTKISKKKMKRYEKDFITMREHQLQQEDPIERWQRESKMQLDTILRLEQENDDLAHQLVTSKIDLRAQLDMTEDQCENLGLDLVQSKNEMYDCNEENTRLSDELKKLKIICRSELDVLETEARTNKLIIVDYKSICSQLSSRIELQQTNNETTLSNIKTYINKCEACKSLLLCGEDKQQWSAVVSDPLSVNSEPMNATDPKRIRELELELAQTKLALVESEVQNQELTHSLNGFTQAKLREETSHKNNWLSKTLTSIKEKAANTSLPISQSNHKIRDHLDRRF